MAGKNDTGKAKAIFKALIPFLALLIVLVFVYFLWRFYHPNGTVDFHQTHVSLLVRQRWPATHLPRFG